MKKLLSLPPNLVGAFHEVEKVSQEEYYCTSDPVDKKLGSGGGTHWLLKRCWQDCGEGTFKDWLSKERRILIHAGGQSRRLPAYAPSGKILTPIPIFRWAQGQRISQNLLQLQLPLYERIMDAAPSSLHTLIASGDVLIRSGRLQHIPDADVVCYGLWVDPSLAKNHGVFLSRRNTPNELDFMLQKPSVETLGELMHTHFFMMDVGIWLLSDRAVEMLMKHSGGEGDVTEYDLYGDFGCALGTNPSKSDSEISKLRVAVLPLQDGEFYHFGTTGELISSMVSLQNLVYDQRSIMHLGVKPHPSIFVQNAHREIELNENNQNVWIENSWISSGWKISNNHVLTGIPKNNWNVNLPAGMCVDVVPIGTTDYALRIYNFNDRFDGDEQFLPKFPVCHSINELGTLLMFLTNNTNAEGEALLMSLPKFSAAELSNKANLVRLYAQRNELLRDNLTELANNHKRSIFYQTDLADMAKKFHELNVQMPKPLDDTATMLQRSSDQMFRRQLLHLNGKDGSAHEAEAFRILREGITQRVLDNRQSPKLDVCADQIVWGRSPVRIDLAGGWTDTPPFCLMQGGRVINIAIELNGQPPLQTYIKCSKEPKIILRSIDLGATEVITSYEQLIDFSHVGSPFSIPKAALCLAGFHPQYSSNAYASLEEHLRGFGCGIEITLLSAIPAGSGLGTSSILAATVLGALNDFCGLGWDKVEICNRTLVLEQMLTTGGGWQDQYGGVLHGIKLLSTTKGFEQIPEVRWLPDTLFTSPEFSACHLLYYTGITRTAKDILVDIVRNMFLGEASSLELLYEMKEHTMDLYNAIQQADFNRYGLLVNKTWEQNKALDSGTNPKAVESIINLVKDYCLGYKLPGAGGGGFLYMVAKDIEAAGKIRQILTSNRPNDRARFVEMTLSTHGQQISRS